MAEPVDFAMRLLKDDDEPVTPQESYEQYIHRLKHGRTPQEFDEFDLKEGYHPDWLPIVDARQGVPPSPVQEEMENTGMNKPHRFIHETGHQTPLDELPMDDQYNARYMAQWERDEMGVPPPGAVEPIDEELQPYLDELAESTGETGYPWGYIPAPLYNEATHFTTGEPMEIAMRLLKGEDSPDFRW